MRTPIFITYGQDKKLGKNKQAKLNKAYLEWKEKKKQLGNLKPVNPFTYKRINDLFQVVNGNQGPVILKKEDANDFRTEFEAMITHMLSHLDEYPMDIKELLKEIDK